jgi:hypothetical protein
MKVKIVKDGAYSFQEKKVDRIEIETPKGIFMIYNNQDGIQIYKNGKENMSILPSDPNRIIID